MRERKFFVHGADVDDFSRAICLPKVTHDRLRYKKHALQVDIEHSIEIRFRHIPEISAFLQARVIDEDIDFAEGRDGLFDEPLAVRNISDIRLKSGRAPLHLGYSLDYFVRTFFVLAIADGDIRAFARQTLRDRAADSLIAACYGGYFALQSIGHHSSYCFFQITTRSLAIEA